MKNVMRLGIALSVVLAAADAGAGPITNPDATVQSTALGGGLFDYKITLTDAASSPDPIGTFWFSWVPGKDFMNTAPASVISPAGWTDMVTNGGPADGFAIQWVAGNAASAITPGQSLTFEFTSTETPAQLMGNSPTSPTFPEGTSFVYSGAPFSDAGTQFTVSPAASAAVPEPSTLALAVAGGLALLLRRGIRRRKPG
jgi:PEP-CTERM motif